MNKCRLGARVAVDQVPVVLRFLDGHVEQFDMIAHQRGVEGHGRKDGRSMVTHTLIPAAASGALSNRRAKNSRAATRGPASNRS